MHRTDAAMTDSIVAKKRKLGMFQGTHTYGRHAFLPSQLFLIEDTHMEGIVGHANPETCIKPPNTPSHGNHIYYFPPPHQVDSFKSELVQIKNGKVTFSEKKFDLEKDTATLKELCEFHEYHASLEATEIAMFPEQFLPLLSKLVQER